MFMSAGLVRELTLHDIDGVKLRHEPSMARYRVMVWREGTRTWDGTPQYGLCPFCWLDTCSTSSQTAALRRPDERSEVVFCAEKKVHFSSLTTPMSQLLNSLGTVVTAVVNEIEREAPPQSEGRLLFQLPPGTFYSSRPAMSRVPVADLLSSFAPASHERKLAEAVLAAAASTSSGGPPATPSPPAPPVTPVTPGLVALAPGSDVPVAPAAPAVRRAPTPALVEEEESGTDQDMPAGPPRLTRSEALGPEAILRWAQRVVDAGGAANVQEAKALADENKDGVVTREEMRNLMAAVASGGLRAAMPSGPTPVDHYSRRPRSLGVRRVSYRRSFSAYRPPMRYAYRPRTTRLSSRYRFGSSRRFVYRRRR